MNAEAKGDNQGDNRCWFLINTLPRQEARADSNLRAWQVETFSPKLKENHYNHYTGKPSCVIKPLFPGYIFARFAADNLLQKVRYTRGVQSVVSFGSGPTPVDEQVVSLLRSRVKEDGFVRVGESFLPGDEVIVQHGPLKDFVGILEQEMKDTDRVMILLKTVSYQARIVVGRDMIRKKSQ